MNGKFKVSVIVPVYNTQKYLETCLTSLIEQTLDGLEIIVVNDGSTDNSSEIIEWFQRRYERRLIVVNKENGGLSSARNAGFRVARGEYVGFVDSDDFVDRRMYEVLYTRAKESNLDIVQCLYLNWYDSNPSKNHPYRFLEHDSAIMTGKDYFELDPSVGACDKLYKKNFLDRIDFRFEEGIYAEDALLIPQVFYWATRVQYVNEIFYYYRRDNANSITNPNSINKSIKLAKDKMYVARRLNEFREEHDWNGNINRVIIPHIVTPFLKKELLVGEYRRNLIRELKSNGGLRIVSRNMNGRTIMRLTSVLLRRLKNERRI